MEVEAWLGRISAERRLGVEGNLWASACDLDRPWRRDLVSAARSNAGGPGGMQPLPSWAIRRLLDLEFECLSLRKSAETPTW
jgi:hypothetical protein